MINFLVLKEDPDDLSHLESNAVVDECRPLDETPLFNDVLAGLMSSYDGLLPDEINSLDSSTSSIGDVVIRDGQIFNNNNDNNSTNHNHITTALGNIGHIETKVKNQMNNNSNTTFNLNGEKHGHIDPFINHRDESNDTNHSQHLSSLTVTSTSPEGSSLPSLCSPHSVSQDDEFAFMRMNDDEIDLTMRAPYIPMNEQDDLPLLTADDLMWCDNNTFTTDELNIKDADCMQIELNETQMQQQQQPLQHHLQQQQRMQANNLNNLLTYQQLQQQQQQQFLLQQQQEQLQLDNPLNQHVQRLQELEQQALLQQQLQTDTSELAALLCGAGNVNTISTLLDNCNGCNNTNEPQFWNNSLRLQQQQQQQPLRNLTNDCKKEKFDRTTTGADTIDDVYEQIYNKESTNLDCWNELLQINGQDVAITNNGETEVMPLLLEQQQQQQQQQILLNDEKNKSILNDKFLTTTTPTMIVMRNKNVLEDMHGIGNGNGNGFNLNQNVQQQQQQQLVINLQQQQLQQHPHGNKRQYSTTTTTTASSSIATNKSCTDLSSEITEGLAKRIKNTNQKTKPSTQLLHHLMTNTTTAKQKQQQQQQQTVGSTTTTAQVIQLKNNNKQKCNTTHKQIAVPTLQQQQQQQTEMQQKNKTNSVLKNLLVSGCDVSAGYCIIPMRPKTSQKNMNNNNKINFNDNSSNTIEMV